MRNALFVSGFFDLFTRKPGAPSPADPTVLAQRIESGESEFTLIDVRTSEEYQAGHIQSALNISYLDIDGNPPKTPKDSLIIVYCRTGGRSAHAKRTLEGKGYTNVVNFGGVFKWRGPLVTGPKPR